MLTPTEIAWVALLPCALVAAIAIVVLGPPLGHALPGAGSDGLWPPGWPEARGHPMPVKEARYILAVLAPVLLVGVIVAAARRDLSLRPRIVRTLAIASQIGILAFVVLGAVAPGNVLPIVNDTPIFGVRTLAIAAVLVVAGVVAMRRGRLPSWLSEFRWERTWHRHAAVVVAATAAAVWVLPSIATDKLAEDSGSLDWTLNDAFAILNGRTPLVNFHVLYAQLLPYPTAVVLSLFGKTALVYTIAMAILSVLALVAVYAVFRRIVRSSLLALGLFLPFVAASDIGGSMSFTAMWPMRYGGAYLLAWLTARHVDGRRPQRPWVLFFLGGLLGLDDLAFGTAAVVATALAVLFAGRPRSLRAALPLVGQIVGGVLGAIAVVSLFTYARAGALPSLSVLLEWPRIFSRLGWFTLPVPTASLHLVIYATFVAAIALAVVRSLRPDQDRLLTSMLMWSGAFGLLAGSYYVGRPDTLKLVSMLSAWSFALSLLTIVCVRALVSQGSRRPTLAQLLVLFGFALSICAIKSVPVPQQSLDRIVKQGTGPVIRPLVERFLFASTHSGERVVILVPMSYRIAYDLGLENVSPYGTEEALVTRWQLQTVIDVARREHAHQVFVLAERVAPQQLRVLSDAGFRKRGQEMNIIDLAD